MAAPTAKRSPQQLEKLRQYARDNNLPELIYEDFQTFAKFMIPKWTTEKLDWIWAHEYIANTFQKVFDGEIDYYTLETPPQLGKTALTCLFITYLFGSNPDLSIMYFTYNEARAIEVTKKYIFPIMSDPKYKLIFPMVILKSDIPKTDHSSDASMKKKLSKLADNSFNLINPLYHEAEYKGRYFAFGLGQGSQGNAADYLFLDDYVGSGDKIKSETFRLKLENAIYSDLISRFQPSTRFIITCTRWYERDPIGVLQERMEVVIQGNIQAGFTPPVLKSSKIRANYRVHDDNPPEDPRTEDGQWLWPAMINKMLMVKDTPLFQVMYNCDPSFVESGKQISIENFGWYYMEELPKFGGRIIISIDGASTAGKRSDHTAIGAWMVIGKKRYLLKLWHVRYEIPKLIALVENILDNEYSDYYQVIIEFANSGVALSQHLTDPTNKYRRGIIPLGFTGKPLVDSNIKKVAPKSFKDITSRYNSKNDRYIRMIPEFLAQDKRIFLPQDGIEHLDTFIKQITTFSNVDGNPDDMVDMCSYLVNYTSMSTVIAPSISLNIHQTSDRIDNKKPIMNYSNLGQRGFNGRSLY